MPGIQQRKLLFLLCVAVIATLASRILACAETEHFEKGDLLFRSGPLWYGHTGIYYKWDDDEDNNPENREDHSIIEAPGQGKLSWQKPYQYFYNAAAFKRGGSKNLTAQQRQRVIELAKNRLDWKYALTEGYKDRSINGKFFKTYRCDGLAEHCYEIALGNYGIVNDYHWDGRKEGGLYPYGQMNSMMLSRPIPPRVKINEIIPGEYIEDRYFIKDLVTIKSSADDGAHGSGIAQVEFWLDYPDDTPNDAPGIRIRTDDHDEALGGNYFCYWDTATVDDGEYTLYAKAFDQAGNTKVSEGVPVEVKNKPLVQVIWHDSYGYIWTLQVIAGSVTGTVQTFYGMGTVTGTISDSSLHWHAYFSVTSGYYPAPHYFDYYGTISADGLHASGNWTNKAGYSGRWSATRTDS